MVTSEATVGKTQESRVAIVTGAAQGIGKAIALRLARDGFSVCVNDITANQTAIDEVVESIRALGRESCGCAADVSQGAEVQTLVSTCVEKLGPLDAMIANAGICQVKSLLELSEQEVRRIFDINVVGVFNCFQTASKHFIAQKSRGKLIAAASVASFKAFPMLSHYSSTKFAIRGLVQGFAQEMAPHGITANGYCPGIVGTSMLDMIDDVMAKASGGQSGDAKAGFGKMIALGRLSEPEDVAKLVSYLAGPDSDYMTGQNIVIDGGIILT
ncbi:hypothetical protein EDD36DRAFT_59291 [Exophiala viscosa]|uniref:Diacetyl reductase [(S)-acetoin forming] n=1 Tax=Exophiala viscosa TaxID=2486360 RepID=A0AAN6DNX1_9EURO|nr:hypothetical protein EDD36DRAFT_59291 [Exophiala viscosa]